MTGVLFGGRRLVEASCERLGSNVGGYTRMAEADKAGTLDALQLHRRDLLELLLPCIGAVYPCDLWGPDVAKHSSHYTC